MYCISPRHSSLPFQTCTISIWGPKNIKETISMNDSTPHPFSKNPLNRGQVFLLFGLPDSGKPRFELLPDFRALQALPSYYPSPRHSKVRQICWLGMKKTHQHVWSWCEIPKNSVWINKHFVQTKTDEIGSKGRCRCNHMTCWFLQEITIYIRYIQPNYQSSTSKCIARTSTVYSICNV